MTEQIYTLQQPKPEGEWIGWKAWMDLHGSSHRHSEVLQFAAAADRARANGQQTSLSLQREPENPHDRNAIAAFGVVGNRRWHIGYVPREDAQELAAFHEAMPLAGRVISVRLTGDRAYVRVQILIPSKRKRLDRGWELSVQ